MYIQNFQVDDTQLILSFSLFDNYHLFIPLTMINFIWQLEMGEIVRKIP